jgi:hypothetical protein
MLEGSLVWEVRTLWFVAVGVLVRFFMGMAVLVVVVMVMGMAVLVVVVMVRPRTCLRFTSCQIPFHRHCPHSQIQLSHGHYAMSVLCATFPGGHTSSPKPWLFAVSLSLAQDTIFSCVVTALFLRPIFKVLGEVGDVRSEGRISMEKTKWLTLLGASLAVLSSTALYINGGLWALLGGFGTPYWVNPYLHIFVFGINLDSVLNDVGVLLACGVLKNLTHEAAETMTAVTSEVKRRFSTTSKHAAVIPAPLQPTGAYAEPPMVFASQGDNQMD